MKKAKLIIAIVATTGLAVVLILTVGGSKSDELVTGNNSEEQTIENTVQNEQPLEETAEQIKIVASGDMLPHDSVNLRAETGAGYDYKPYFESVADIMSSGDAVFCNQESASAGQQFGIAGYPSFNAPEQFAKDLNALGCDVINLANNHVADRGVEGIEATLDVWSTLDTKAVAGANRSQEEQNSISYFEIKGVRFAFLAFTDLTNNANIPSYSINIFSDELVSSLTQLAKANADVVIVSAHWGVEYSPEVSSSQQYWANLLAENGADIIIGTGPHVLQTIDEIQNQDRKTLVMYSLGNMLSTQLEIEQLIGGFAEITFSTADIGNYQISFTPTYMHYEWTADQAAAEDLLARNNLAIYRLSQAAQPLSRSLFNTTVEEQTNRVDELLNRNFPINLLD